MATIKITGAHNYGHVADDGIVRLKTAADAPFELNDQRAAELVADGVAVYVDGHPYSADLKATDLRKIGKEMGLTFRVGTTKAEMVAAIDAHNAEAVPDDDLPELDLDEVVQ